MNGRGAAAAVAAAALAALLALAGCSTPPTLPRAVPLPESTRTNPEHYVVVTVRNARTALNPYAASTPRGYSGQGPYSAGASAIGFAREVAARHGLREVAAWPIELLGVHCVVYELPAGAEREQVLAALRADAAVESAQALVHFELHAAFNDAYAPLQRNLVEMDIAAAQQWSRGNGVRIAVIDTGVDTSHPDFGGRLAAVHDFVADGRRIDEGHGTAVAGVIAAVPNNGIGIAGIAPQAQVLSLRACWSPGRGSGLCNSFTLAQALIAASNAGAALVNLSLGGPSDPLLTRIVEQAMKRGVVFVGALPASGQRDGFPTAIDGVIAVDVAGRPGAAQRVLLAPGIDVFTLSPQGRYDAATGSSVAAAGVTAVAALLLARRPGLDARAIETLLQRSMRAPRAPPGTAATVNACSALSEMLNTGGCDAGVSIGQSR
jgi:hypothetical protein